MLISFQSKFYLEKMNTKTDEHISCLTSKIRYFFFRTKKRDMIIFGQNLVIPALVNARVVSTHSR
jgi:hypothetical protein